MQRTQLFALYAAGKIEPVIYGRYELDDLPVALGELGGRKTHGKLVVTP